MNETIPWKVFWTILGPLGTLAAAVGIVKFGVPTMVGIVGFLAAAVLFAFAARTVVHGEGTMFKGLSLERKNTISHWLVAAGFAHAVWGIGFLARPDLWLAWTIGVGVLGGVEYGVARTHEYMLSYVDPKKAAGSTAVAPADAAADAGAQPKPKTWDTVEDEVREKLGWVFILSGHSWLQVSDPGVIVSVQNGRSLGVRALLEISMPVVAAPVGRSARQKKPSDKIELNAEDRKRLAIALRQVTGVKLHSDWVTLIEQPDAGVYELVVLFEDVLSTVYPYVDDPTETTSDQPQRVGYQVNGEPHMRRLDCHGADIGRSRMGKSSKINCKLADTTRMTDAAQWVCGTSKLYDLMGGWIEPFMGQPYKIPFNWVVFGPRHTLLMLATALVIARWRQNQPMRSRCNFKTIFIQFDEANAQSALQNSTISIDLDGVPYTMSKVVLSILNEAGGGKVWLHVAAHRMTDPNLGAFTTDITNGLAWRSIFAVGDVAEIGRATDDYNLENPRNKGEFWDRGGEDEQITKLKSAYMQEIDPGKPKLHDGPTISDVAWARRWFGHDLDEGSARVAANFAGALYSERFQYATPEFENYLRGNGPMAGGVPESAEVVDESATGAAGASSSEEAVRAEAEAELNALFGEVPTAAGEAGEPGLAKVTTMSRPRTIRDRVLAVIRAADGDEISRAEIITALAAEGPEVGDQVVTNTLSDLVKDGSVERAETRGQYRAA